MTQEIIIQAIISGLLMGFVYALISVGLSLMFGLMEIVNFAHGEFLMLSMYTAFWLWSLFGLDPLLALPVCAALFFGLGIATHYGIIRHILHASMLVQICATFGLAIFLRSLAQFLWTPDPRTIIAPLVEGRVEVMGIFLGLPQIVASLMCLAAFVLLYLFISRTETGMALQATAQDRQAASLMGIPAERMYALGWGIGAACVSIAGVLLATFRPVNPEVGALYALLAYVAVALGGCGSIMGCLFAGLLIGQMEALAGWLIDPSYKYVTIFGLYLVVVFLRPQGLFGRY